MSDITERLREIRDRDCYDAAAEIERLRADCAKLETAHGQNMREISRLRAELAAERERKEHYQTLFKDMAPQAVALREALREARDRLLSLEDYKLSARIDALLANSDEAAE